MANSPTKSQAQNVNVIFPFDLISRVDEHAERMKKKTPALQITRSDAVRDLVMKALGDVERPR